MGKFGRYQLHDWYARKRDSAESIDNERASVQAYEEELMHEALGLKPKRLLLSKKQLTEEELKEFLKRDDEKSEDKKGMKPMGPQKKLVTNEYGEQVATSNEDYVAQAAREAPIKGLGFAMHRTAKLEEIKAKTFGTESQLAGSTSQSSTAKAEKLEVKEEVKYELHDHAAAGGFVEPCIKEELAEVKEDADQGKHRCQGQRCEADLKERRRKGKKEKEDKEREKAEKKLRKIAKKLKKAAKKEDRAAKRARMTNARCNPSSSSS